MLACTHRYIAAARLLSGKLIAISPGGKRALMLAADCLALPLCFQLALLIGGAAPALPVSTPPAIAPPAATLPVAQLLVAPLLVATSLAALSISELYGAAVRYLDQRRLALAAAGLAAAALCIHLLTLDRGDAGCPPGALVIYWFVALSYLVASRQAARGFLRRHTRPPPSEAVAIYGAGDLGARLAQAMQGDGQYCPVCFFDEKARRARRTLAGLPVLGPERLAEVVAAASIRLIVVALPAVSGERLGAVLRMLRGAGVSIKFLHGLLDLEDHAMRRQLSSRLAAPDFPLEQLLGRPPVQPDAALFARCVQGKGVLVTGAGGSIGSELCRQIAGLGPRCLHLLDHSEFALYTIRQELQARWPQLAVRPHLGSACSARLLERVMQADRIDTVYHAAAYKHVTLVEANVVEGLRNNVLGAQAVVRAAAAHRVDTCVLVSSDKAVRPSTIMGASKRVSELVFQAAAAGAPHTVFSMVRFGNVLGSSGSVVPLFHRQLQQGGPLTVTDAAMERYFMLIPEAAQLVIQAGAMAEGGDVFVLDMGQPVRIVDLARRMIALAGLSEKTAQHPQGEIEIQYVGLCPGEKLREELLSAEHRVAPSRHPRILRMTEQALAPALLDQYIELLLLACGTNDRWLIEAMLQTIVHEFTPHGGAAASDSERALRAIAELAMAPLPAHAS